jgi:hypothetical protein
MWLQQSELKKLLLTPHCAVSWYESSYVISHVHRIVISDGVNIVEVAERTKLTRILEWQRNLLRVNKTRTDLKRLLTSLGG